MYLLFFQDSGGRTLQVCQEKRTARRRPSPEAGWLTRTRFKIRNAYERLKEKLNYYENLCSDMRKAEQIVVIHSQAVAPEHAERQIRQFFDVRYGHHRNWFRVDLILALLGSLLMPLPGPNVFFLYPAARAYGHHQARKGASHALGLQPWTYRMDGVLDRVESRLGQLSQARSDLADLEKRYGLDRLEKTLESLRRG